MALLENHGPWFLIPAQPVFWSGHHLGLDPLGANLYSRRGSFGQRVALGQGSSALPLPHAGPLPTVTRFHQALLTGSRFGLCLRP